MNFWKGGERFFRVSHQLRLINQNVYFKFRHYGLETCSGNKFFFFFLAKFGVRSVALVKGVWCHV